MSLRWSPRTRLPINKPRESPALRQPAVPRSLPGLSAGRPASIIVASLGRAASPNCPDHAGRQIAFFLPFPGYDPRSIIAEAQGPPVYRELSGPAVFILDNECHAVAVHRFQIAHRNGIKRPVLTQN